MDVGLGACSVQSATLLFTEQTPGQRERRGLSPDNLFFTQKYEDCFMYFQQIIEYMAFRRSVWEP